MTTDYISNKKSILVYNTARKSNQSHKSSCNIKQIHCHFNKRKSSHFIYYFNILQVKLCNILILRRVQKNILTKKNNSTFKTNKSNISNVNKRIYRD